MKIVLFCHSLLSDWNHGNAHFLRGVCTELSARGHTVRVFEPKDAWSVENLIAEAGSFRLDETRAHYPALAVERYDPGRLDLDRATSGADLVIVHEWNPAWLVERLGLARSRGASYRLLFHDTHHRSVTEEESIAALDLSGYDGVLAFGEAVKRRYEDRGWSRRVWTWHEAADVRMFKPLPEIERDLDLVWIGNWGDGERSRELDEFLFEPARRLGLSATVYGVRYPREGLEALARAGIEFGGWLPNYRVPEAMAGHRVTIHVPRAPYVRALPGIPTIRIFEALACGMPLVCSGFEDREGLFGPDDFLRVTSGAEMERTVAMLLADAEARDELGERGRRTILARHTCAHRVDELLDVCRQIGAGGAPKDGDLTAQGREVRAWD